MLDQRLTNETHLRFHAHDKINSRMALATVSASELASTDTTFRTGSLFHSCSSAANWVAVELLLS